ncbi:hypothetical protein PAXRUDRAFT_705184 [Paxillus rubicundulus Ve08.2h10]|uniref:Uncharacterized protein n=1 Tax=Paxillus rubicundulus Ve08.2h10 TaxID=930991 RepID=A0A0D0DUT1_9AGAM|nr:hypothetical protein PAXRUDRAFT_705184 [Paxillus rubicundulus Ve08.2h10]
MSQTVKNSAAAVEPRATINQTSPPPIDCKRQLAGTTVWSHMGTTRIWGALRLKLEYEYTMGRSNTSLSLVFLVMRIQVSIPGTLCRSCIVRSTMNSLITQYVFMGKLYTFLLWYV